MNYHFARAIREGRQPYLDVYRGVVMSCVGILAYRSALADSAPVVVPDFRDPAARQAVANDHWSPDPAHKGPEQPPSSILGDLQPPPEALDFARQIWQQHGYQD